MQDSELILGWINLVAFTGTCEALIDRRIKLYGFPKGSYRIVKQGKIRVWVKSEVIQWIESNKKMV